MDKEKEKTAIVLFSGGTDSTLTAALVEEHYSSIELITYSRYGIFEAENASKNAQLLIDKFGRKISHKIIDFEKVFKKIAYQKYIKNIVEHGFMNLSTCGLCKLSMHVMTIAYCLENKISYVADGANKGMELFPAQMKDVIAEIRELYKAFNITYENPVFEYEPPEDKSLIKDKEMANLVNPKKTPSTQKLNTAGKKLYELGLSPEANIKGSKYDRNRQPRCYQFVLFSTYINKWYLPRKSKEEYQKETLTYYKKKIAFAKELLENKKENKGIFDLEEKRNSG